MTLRNATICIVTNAELFSTDTLLYHKLRNMKFLNTVSTFIYEIAERANMINKY